MFINNDINCYRKLYPKLPPPLTITPSQIKSYYQSFYDKLLVSYNKKDFIRVKNLLRTTAIITNLPYPLSKEDPSKTNLLVDLALLVYKIITIYPVKYYKTQTEAAVFLCALIKSNKTIPGLELEWKPLWKVIHFYQSEFESTYISGKLFMPKKTNHNVFFSSSNIYALSDIQPLLSEYYKTESETKVDGLIVKTNTTEQLVKKYFPNVSINLTSLAESLINFINFIPPAKGEYKKFLDYILYLFKDPKPFKNESVLTAINNIIKANIEDDFSCLLPFLYNLTNDQMLSRFSYSFLFLPNLFVSLFISPPTRTKILDLLESLFISFKSTCHPSVQRKGFSDLFIEKFITSLRVALKKLSKKSDKKFFYNMDPKLGPSQEELHQLLSMTSEITIMNIRNCFDSKLIFIETTLDPLLIDRYFDIAIQCIDLTDAFSVARSGWTILTALFMHIDTNEKLRNNFETIFQIATNNLYRAELKSIISHFLFISFLKVPFDRKKTLKGLENIDFGRLAYSYFSNLIAMLRTLPSAKDEAAEAESGNISYIALSSNELFRNCESEVFDELLPIFESLAYDEGIYPCINQVEIIIANYCYYSKREQAMKVIKAFQSKFESSESNLNNFRYFSNILSTALSSTMKDKESYKQSVDLIMPYVNSDNEKIRKVAWQSVDAALCIFSRICNVNVELKPEKMINYPFENAKLEDFNISYTGNPDVTDIDYETLDPIFDKLLTIEDQYELNNYYDDFYDRLVWIVKTVFLFTEGSQEFFNDAYNSSISFIPEMIKKSVPIKDKFIKVLNRILTDFPENENLVDKVIFSVNELFLNFFQSSLSTISGFFLPFDQSKKNYNNGFLYNAIINTFDQRKTLYMTPVSDDIKTLFEKIINLTVSSSKAIRDNCTLFISSVWYLYYPLIVPNLEKIIERKESIPMKDLAGFLSSSLGFEFLFFNVKLFCDLLLYLLKNFEANEKDKDFLEFFTNFLVSSKTDSPFETISEDSPEFVNLLNEIEKNYLNKLKPNRSFISSLLDVIVVALKHVKDVNDNILSFIIKQIVHYDQHISICAYNCLIGVLERRQKYTKEKVQVKEFPTISSMPNFLDKVTVKLPQNGFYFPSNLKTLNAASASANQNDNDDQISDTISAEYSIDINPTTSIDVNFDGTEVNEEVIKVFESFKKVEIEINITEKEKELLDTEFMSNHSNGFFLFKDHYTHKKYEFVEDKTLINLIPDIFASAINAINEKSLVASVSYSQIWDHYATTVGPFCIKKLEKLARKYLSEYFAVSPIVTSKIMIDMLIGFLNRIFYWNYEDRINFIKLVALPVVCVISSSPFVNTGIRTLLSLPAENASPFCIAPMIKVMFELYDKGPSCDHFNSCFLNNIVHVIKARRVFFFNQIDVLTAKYISPFIENMKDYKMNEIADISFLFFRLFDCCSLIPKSSPLHTNEIESKTAEMLSILDSILQKENINDCLIYFLINSFRFFNDSSFYTRILVAPVFIKNMKIIFKLLKNARISTEESFIISFRSFIENDIFFSDSKIQFDFFSSFIAEMMNAPLPLQQILLENINNMLEHNIFSISKDDYEKFEEIIINYGKHENMKNFGNELRMKIAKVLGIFELRKCSLKKSDIDFEKVATDENLKEEIILKAASIILNAYLFDRVDDRVTGALETMEKFCIKTGNDPKNKVFFKSVLEIFIHRHTNHVINEVEEILIQYKYMMSPSYIC